LATPRPVRIPRTVSVPAQTPLAAEPTAPAVPADLLAAIPRERRVNEYGSQRAVRITLVYVVALAALYAGFVLYDRTAPGGMASPTENGILLLTALFATFAAVGVFYTLTPAPRGVEVMDSGVVVVGRWGRRRSLPPIGQLSVRVVRRYPIGWLNNEAVELVEVWAPDLPVRSYLADAGLFAGASASPR